MPCARPLLLAGSLLALPVLLALGPAPVAADAQMHFTWSACDDHAHNLPASGQTQMKQVISVSGLAGNPGMFQLQVSLGRYGWWTNAAWLCALGALDPSVPVAGVLPATDGPCGTIPGLQVTGMPGMPCVTPDGCTALVLISGTFPPGTDLDPARTYALAELRYDYSRSGSAGCTPGPSAEPQCFGLVYSSLSEAPYFAQPEWLLSWNRPDGNADACAGVVPTRTRTWGEIKTLYR